MGSMKKLEQALSRAGRTDVSAAAGVAAGRLADQAASDGLLDVAYTTMDSPVGPVLIAATQRGLVRISFCSHYDPDEVLLELSKQDLSARDRGAVVLRRGAAGAGRVLPGAPHAASGCRSTGG